MEITLENTRIAHAFRKSLNTYDQAATVQHRMARDLVDELKKHGPRQFDRVLELGCGTGQLTRMMLSAFFIEHYAANDLVPECETGIDAIFARYPKTKGSFLAGDAETFYDYPDALSLLVSGATFQWLDDLNGFLARITPYLAPEGILAFSTFGPDNCKEIRTLTGLGLDYPTLDKLKGYLKKDYHILAVRESHETCFFDTPMAVLRHLKATGVNGIAAHRWTPKGLAQFCENYTMAYQQGAGVPLTYHPVLIVARKK
ncbi:MAG: malonyl-ACP O-methyltransferase BioC [Candidatus Hydrogenedentes bacterium]|nr:malonyl-ACP O-methyltransferase BioC [Candidatus Hydrogenedentota bacterium]